MYLYWRYGMNSKEEAAKNRIDVIQRAAKTLNLPYTVVEEAWEYQFKFVKEHVENAKIEPILLKRLGRFMLGGRYKGPETFEMIDNTKKSKISKNAI